MTQNDLYSSSSSSGTHANYLEDNWDIQKTYDGRPSSSVRFVKLTIRTNWFAKNSYFKVFKRAQKFIHVKLNLSF